MCANISIANGLYLLYEKERHPGKSTLPSSNAVKDMELANIKIYRMTHISNIPHILINGITHKASPNANPNYVVIGDVSLIDTRSAKRVTVDNGEFTFGAPAIVLGDYIPFYFGVRMPMLYVMQNGGNFVRQATPPWDIVYMACTVSNVIETGATYYFSDGHATDNYTTFYDQNMVDQLPKLVDWNAVKTQYWGGQENLNVKRKKQAEFLVAEDVPATCIVGFGCYNEVAKTKLKAMGIKEDIIKVIPHAYY